MKMTQVTLRNVDEELKELIDQNARKRGTSVNQYVLDVLKSSLGYKGQNKPQGWRAFSGTVPADGISPQALEDFEKIDTTMWQD